jgi:hypothetical protein
MSNEVMKLAVECGGDHQFLLPPGRGHGVFMTRDNLEAFAAALRSQSPIPEGESPALLTDEEILNCFRQAIGKDQTDYMQRVGRAVEQAALAQQAREVEQIKAKYDALESTLVGMDEIATRLREERDQLRAQLAEAQQTLKDHGEIQAALCQQLAEQSTKREELRKTVAEIIGADPAVWPDHGNLELAIAACIGLRQAELKFRDEAEYKTSAGGDAVPFDVQLDDKQEAAFQSWVGVEEMTPWQRSVARLALLLNTTRRGLIDYGAAQHFANELVGRMAAAAHPPASAGDAGVPWRVGEYWSSSSPGTKVLCLAVGEKEIAAHGAHKDFIRWVSPSPASAGGVAVPDGWQIELLGETIRVAHDAVGDVMIPRMSQDPSDIVLYHLAESLLAAAPSPQAPGEEGGDLDRVVDWDATGKPITARTVQEMSKLKLAAQQEPHHGD